MIKGFITYDKAVKFNRVSRELKLPYSTKDQFVRAAESIALNLAEGSAKPTVRDRKKFYYIALGSLRECQAILEIKGMESTEAYGIADELGALLWKLTRS